MTKPAKTHESLYEKTFLMINVASIDENDENPRSSIENIDDLKASIKAHGLLQPIVVRDGLPNHHWKVIAGSRRFRACKELGMGAVPCYVIHVDDEKAFELATAENVVRENIAVAIGVKMLVFVLVILGLAGMGAAVFVTVSMNSG